jgi:hypothetical protein
MCAEEMTDDAMLIRVKRVLLDVNTVPYIPELFSAQNPPEPVSFWLLGKSSAGTHSIVPELSATSRHPRPDHLLPSAAAEVKKAQASDALPSGETTESGSPLAERAAEGKANKNISSESSVELVEALPSVPQGRRVVRKRKANVVESTRYGTAVL